MTKDYEHIISRVINRNRIYFHPNFQNEQLDLFLHSDLITNSEDSEKKEVEKNLAKELFNFIHLEIAYNDVEELFKLFNQHLLSEKDRYILQTATDTTDRYLYFLIVMFSPFFIRPPRTMPETGDYKKVLDHLFADYKVPEFLYQEWLKPFNSVNFKWIAWFILFGQGFSLKKAGKLFDWHYPRRFQSKLWEVPENFTPEEACAIAFIEINGGKQRDIDLILGDPVFSYKIDPTNGRKWESEDFTSIWKSTVKWLTNHRDKLKDEEYKVIMKWSIYLYSHQNDEIYREKLFFQNLEEIRKDAKKRVFIEKKLCNEPISWESHNLDWSYKDDNNAVWLFTELTSEIELSQESAELAHCVKTYVDRCFWEKSAILSLSRNGEKCITIEFSLKKCKVVQIAGYYNRVATDSEQRVITKWAEEVKDRIKRRKVAGVSLKKQTHSILETFQKYELRSEAPF